MISVMERHRQDGVTVVSEVIEEVSDGCVCLSQEFKQVGGCEAGVRPPVKSGKEHCANAFDEGRLHPLYASGARECGCHGARNESRATSTAGSCELSYALDEGTSQSHVDNLLGLPSFNTCQTATDASQFARRSGTSRQQYGGCNLLHARGTSIIGHEDCGKRYATGSSSTTAATEIDTSQIATSTLDVTPQHDHRSSLCSSLPDILYTGNGNSYCSEHSIRVPASAESHDNDHEFKLIADERVPAWQSQVVDDTDADSSAEAEEVRLIEERVPAARSWDMTRCTGNLTTSCLSKGKGDIFDPLGIGDGRSVERGRRRKRRRHVHSGGECERFRRDQEAKEQILADFARFEWPSKEQDVGIYKCPSLVASNTSLLSACSASTDAASLKCFLADLHFGLEDDETSTTERDARALRDTIAKLKASGAGMKSLDPKLLQHLRSAHSSWRRSSSQLELPTREAEHKTSVEVSSTREATGEYRSMAGSLEASSMPVRTLAVTEPSADEIIDALDDAFQPTILGRKSQASDVSNTEVTKSPQYS